MSHVRITLAIVLLSAATVACQSVERLPPGPIAPSEGAGLPGNPDLSTGDDNGDNVLTGFVCRLVDLRVPTSCAQLQDMSAIPLRVRGDQSDQPALTTVDGSFSIDVGAADNIILEVAVETPGFVATVLPVRRVDGLDGVIVPVVAQEHLDLLVETLLVPLAQETGILATYSTFDGDPLSGVVIDGISFSGGIFYNIGGALQWIEADSTGDAGAALVFGVSPPTTEFVAGDIVDGTIVNVDNVPIGADAVTFVSVSFD